MEARKGQDLRQQGLMRSTTARPASMAGDAQDLTCFRRMNFRNSVSEITVRCEERDGLNNGLQPLVGNHIQQLECRTCWTGFALFPLAHG